MQSRYQNIQARTCIQAKFYNAQTEARSTQARILGIQLSTCNALSKGQHLQN